MAFADPGRLDKQRGGARVKSSLGVLPFVAYDKRPVQANVPFKNSFRQQARLGFSAGAEITGVVGTGKNIIEWEKLSQLRMNSVQFLT